MDRQTKVQRGSVNKQHIKLNYFLMKKLQESKKFQGVKKIFQLQKNEHERRLKC
jgi:hypothetical protein